jgi:hypothetical protein
LTPVEGKPQQVGLTFLGGLPETSPGYSIYEIEVRDKPVTVHLPPGKSTIQRSFSQKDGGSRSFPAETLKTAPGDGQKVKLPNISAEEAERKWMEDSLRPKVDNKKPEGK